MVKTRNLIALREARTRLRLARRRLAATVRSLDAAQRALNAFGTVLEDADPRKGAEADPAPIASDAKEPGAASDPNDTPPLAIAQ